MKPGKLISFIFLYFLPFHSMAWGLLGHRVTAEIAEKYLTPKAKAEIQKILGTESMAMASNWADFIKSDSSYNYISPWHYVDIPAGLDSAALKEYLKKDTAADAYTKINFLVSQLKIKTLSQQKKIFYLKLLIHIVGDVHQPMHVAHPEDKGGNDIRLSWFGAATNLHRVWDENLIELQELSYTEMTAAVNHATTAQVKKWQKQPLADWVLESYRISGKLYSEVKPNDKLSYAYNYYHLDILNLQLLRGGIHLAGLLNQIFG